MNKKISIIIIITIAFTLLLSACATKPIVYYFSCNEQQPEIIDTYISQAFKNMGYDTEKDSMLQHHFIGVKKMKVTNTKKGVVGEGVVMMVKFHFDGTNSEITQYYFTELKGKRSYKAFNKEQLAQYGNDVKIFQEKMQFYCNPQFKGR